MNKAYKFRIEPNKEQRELFARTFGCVRFIQYHFLEAALYRVAVIIFRKGLGFEKRK